VSNWSEKQKDSNYLTIKKSSSTPLPPYTVLVRGNVGNKSLGKEKAGLLSFFHRVKTKIPFPPIRENYKFI
jgi:hypothetical protein